MLNIQKKDIYISAYIQLYVSGFYPEDFFLERLKRLGNIDKWRVCRIAIELYSIAEIKRDEFVKVWGVLKELKNG